MPAFSLNSSKNLSLQLPRSSRKLFVVEFWKRIHDRTTSKPLFFAVQERVLGAW